MRAEPAGVIANGGLDEYQELTSEGFLPLTGALCTLDSNDGCKDLMWNVIIAIGLKSKKEKGKKFTVVTRQKEHGKKIW